MPIEAIPFGPQQSSGYEVLGGASPAAHNVIVEPTGVIRRRPTVQALDGLTSDVVDADGIDALYHAEDGRLYAFGGGTPRRKVYRVTTGVKNLSLTQDEKVLGEKRPVIAETEAILAVAAGRQVYKVVLDTGKVSPLANAFDASHVIASNSRLLSNDLDDGERSRVKYSSQAGGSSFAGHEQWQVGSGTAGFFTGESRPDPVVALGETTSEVFVWGTETVQVFAPHPVYSYTPVTTREWGCSAPYGIIRLDESFAWIDNKRRIVLSDGRSQEDIGAPIRRDIQAMPDISDAIGYRIVAGPTDALVWTFPSDGRTYAYQIGGGWSQWMSGGAGGWRRFIVNAHTVRSSDGKNLVATTSGKVGWLDPTGQDDFGDTVQVDVTTGYLSHGTSMRKHCRAVYITLRRGVHATSDTEAGWLQWRDRPGEWTGRIPVRFGARAETEAVVSLRSLGVYRRRQWRFVFSVMADFALVSTQEEFEVLGD